MYGSLRIVKKEDRKEDRNLTIREIIKICKSYQNSPENSNPTKIFHKNNFPFGIPQGLPLSGVVSNISFLSFDAEIKKVCEKYRAYYYRYCDDILIIVPKENYSDEIEQTVKDIIEREKRASTESELLDDSENLTTPYLKINKSKTEVIKFEIGKKPTTYKNDKEVYKPLKYLGLTFDGENVRLKPSGISKQLNKAKYLKKRASRDSKKNRNIPLKKINKRLLNSGYIKYVERASKFDPKIKKQITNLLSKSKII
ncbi:MAG: RNA-directed DNA polymerase [bacterium]